MQYFFAYPPVDLFAWARLLDGRLMRAFAIGDSGVVWNKGRATKEERSLGLKLFDFRGVRGRKGDAGGEIILYPTEEHVLRLAGRWSQDPDQARRRRRHRPEPRLHRAGPRSLETGTPAQSRLRRGEHRTLCSSPAWSLSRAPEARRRLAASFDRIAPDVRRPRRTFCSCAARASRPQAEPAYAIAGSS